jgi:hypothetical protein
MKKIGTLLIVILVVGCAASDEYVRTKNRENLLRLSVGMKKLEVLQIMGTQTFDTINNPYKVETPRGKEGQLYEVFFYHTEMKNNDELVTDAELTPIVFFENQLIGWGWAFLSDIVPNYQYQKQIL